MSFSTAHTDCENITTIEQKMPAILRAVITGIKQRLCRHDYAELGYVVARWPNGGELLTFSKICVKCGGEEK